MGFTPLEGLIMGTRCGDIDPALVPYIMDREKLSAKEIDAIMNKNSGMLGLTETSHDMREIEEEAFRGSERHILALDVYCHRLIKYVGAYMAELGGLDALVFTGGVGEKSYYVRDIVCRNLAAFGIAIDKKKNDKNALDIGTGNVRILVIPTNEELAIARDTQEILFSVGELPVTEDTDVVVEKERAALSKEDKAALILLWAENSDASMVQLTRKLNEKIGKEFKVHTIRRELEVLGLHNGKN
jgi:acetate kinase